MKEALARVAHVLKNSNLAPHLSHVRCVDGWMSASDGRIYVSAPVDCRLDFCVQGTELDRALNFDDMDITRDERGLVFKKGRSRITLKSTSGEEFFEVEQPDAWRPIPEGYIDALFRAREFTSENATQAWALGVMNIDGRLVATNNIVLAVVDFDNPSTTCTRWARSRRVAGTPAMRSISSLPTTPGFGRSGSKASRPRRCSRSLKACTRATRAARGVFRTIGAACTSER
jgi:hypothetical protein